MLGRMYARHFGLQQEPFSIAPDPRYLFMSERHREALAHLLYGLQSGGGFVLLTGEIGAGKTTVCRAFLEQVPANNHVAYIFNPKLTAAELLQSVCDEFAVVVVGTGIKAQVDALNAYLLRTHAAGENNVLVIDEAQSLAADVLEQLRLLTNLETNERKLLQIILIGQPELRDMLARPELEQLAQRVIARFHLGPLDATDTSRYMRHRLAVAGATGLMPFDRGARARVHWLTGGVPRRINLLCDRALLAAYVAGAARVNVRLVDTAAREVFAKGTSGPWRGLPRWAMGLAAALVLVVLGLLVGAIWAWTQFGAPHSVLVAANDKPSSSAQRAASAAPLNTGPKLSNPIAEPEVARALGANASVSANTRPWVWPTEPWPDVSAWRALAVMWNVNVVDLRQCDRITLQGLRCFRTPSTSLAMLRQLARPGVITLQAVDGSTTRVVLTGLTDQLALLRMNDAVYSMALADFGAAWLGDYGTLYRMDASAAQDGDSKRMGADWVASQLSQLNRLPATETLAATLSASAASSPQRLGMTEVKRIQAFQRAQGLVSDGVPGALTLMQLNRALGVAEPRFASTPP